MTFRIASTFHDSLLKLNVEEQKAVKQTAFDLQLNPESPGTQLHRVNRAKDKRFWSARASRDLRLILHRSTNDLLLCYVGHHDDAYHWAERRKLATHPKTGAAQIVEIRETVQEIMVPVYVEEERPARPKPPIFADRSNEELLGYGVPEEWLDDIKAADEDSILVLADHLPEEAAEALLELATGGNPAALFTAPAVKTADPFAHPDAKRRFRVMSNVEELEQALDYPWEKWTIFLHPSQRETVERDYNGPARVSGTAGTGKTIVALHRAVWLARQNPDARILLTTFSEDLAKALRIKLRRLIGNQPILGEQIDVEAMDAVGERLHTALSGKPKLATEREIRTLLEESAAAEAIEGFSTAFLLDEWNQVVDAWQIDSWEAYRDVKRLGRKTRLSESKREQLWKVFAGVQAKREKQGKTTRSGLFTALADILRKAQHPPYDFAVVDEAQDISVAQLRFLAALGGERPGSLFFAGDLGQRIFQQPFSWASLGVQIRGRSKTLKINYRTSHQIRRQADRLLDSEISDVDGNTEKRRDAISVFNGPKPRIESFQSQEEEAKAVAEWLQRCLEEGIAPSETAVFVRSENEIERGQAAIENAGLQCHPLSTSLEVARGSIALSPMHLAKGLEFRAVAVMACDDEVIPNLERIEEIGDTDDLEEIYNTERHLLYVACTRARDQLFVTGTEPTSEFMDDLK